MVHPPPRRGRKARGQGTVDLREAPNVGSGSRRPGPKETQRPRRGGGGRGAGSRRSGPQSAGGGRRRDEDDDEDRREGADWVEEAATDMFPLLVKSHLKVCQELRAVLACVFRRGALSSDHPLLSEIKDRLQWYSDQVRGNPGHGKGSPDMHACQAALRYTAGDPQLETIGVDKCDRFRTLAKKIIGMSKQEQENAIPTFTRKVMKDQRTLIRFSLRIPFEDETIICEGLQSVGVQFLRSREPAGYMESQLSRFLNVMEGRA